MRRMPPGQRESATFHRFGLSQFATRFPKNVETPSLTVDGAVQEVLQLEDPLKGLPRVEQVSDFHCVTTWSVRGVRWGGVRFSDFYERVLMPMAKPHAGTGLVALKAQDGARTGMLLEDLLAPNVLLADHLNGSPLCVDHGAPLRLVAPDHYGYKSVKHLCQLTLKTSVEGYRASGLQFMDHQRARVELEERGRGVPGIVLRYLYRPLVRGTARRFADASAKREKELKAGPDSTE